MTEERVPEIQKRIDWALRKYKDHPDYEDLRQTAWLRLLEAERLHPEADLRKFAAKMTGWETQEFFRKRRGLNADAEALSKTGYHVEHLEDLPAFLHPTEPDFAPLLIRRLSWRASVPWHKLTARDAWLLWQCGALGLSLHAASRRLGIHYSLAHYRYHWAIRLCRKRSRLPE